MNATRLIRVTRAACFIAATISVLVSAAWFVRLAPSLCCEPAFFYLTARISLSFIVLPIVAGLSLTSTSPMGRLLFWVSCAGMALLFWPPFLAPVAAWCIWVRLRVVQCSEQALAL